MTQTAKSEATEVLVIGGGAAGLMAADRALRAGAHVMLVDAKPSLARKVLMAGKSGLNLTKNEDLETFLTHFNRREMRAFVRKFGPKDVCDWADGYDAECFVGSSGKVFPKVMKASPLLRAWFADLDKCGLEVRTRWRWVGETSQDWVFETADGFVRVEAQATVFALGGASWPKLGSDGAWTSRFPISPLRPANVGLEVAWSDFMTPHFGQWLKNVEVSARGQTVKGEVGLTRYGFEGGAIYALGDEILQAGFFELDLLPRKKMDALARSGRESLTNRLRKLKIPPAGRALFFECALTRDISEVKALRIEVKGSRPIEEAISTAGGVTFEALNPNLSLKTAPNVFVAGEMLDWSAPTGGYLLTGCFATGRAVGEAAARYAKE